MSFYNELRTQGDRLKFIRNFLGQSRSEFSTYFNLSINTLKSQESNVLPLTEKSAGKIVQALLKKGVPCSRNWLLSGEGNPEFVNLISTQESLSDLKIESFKQEQAISYEIQTFKKHNPHPIVVIISDDALLPHYEVGDYVGGIEQADNFYKLYGKVCIITTPEGETFVRVLHAGQLKHSFTLLCSNPQTILKEPIMHVKNIQTAAQVIWHRKKFML